MSKVTIAAVGDVSTGHDPAERIFSYVMAPLARSDVRFAQAERVYSERGAYQEQVISKHSRQHPRMAEAFRGAGFDVVSIASNHSGGWGPESVEDTAETFRALGIASIGAGSSIAAARKPALVERNGVRMAFLGYCSVLLPQTWATETRAGAAPMRAHTFYEAKEFQPGAPPRVVTTAHAADLAALVEDVRRAKQSADVVLVSLHWGVHFVPAPCDYQREVAHAAIDAGASVILGHHPHQPQGIEAYKDGIVFYSMGNFGSFRRSRQKSGHFFAAPNGEYTFEEMYTIEPDPGFVFPHNRHYDESGIYLIEADARGVAAVDLIPTLLNETGEPEIVAPDHPQFEKTLTYINWAGKFVPGGITDMRAAGDRYRVFRRVER
jgi:poly-gamma-glutamate capsule biosynthesis protein CapA/YwtB (metallophosphatase superfamily)